jgi:dTDP-4-dehydrorhamnose reductase
MSEKSRIAVFGSSGQLGTDVVEVFRRHERFDVVPLQHQDVDCADADQVRQVILALRPDGVINTAAYVRVDDCEDHTSEAFVVNAIGALNIARACARVDAFCVYVSTDYVFDGAKATAYVESDPTSPVNVYGASKLAGELLIRQALPRSLIVRTASLFGKTGARGKGGNFIETILAKAKSGEVLRVVNDVTMSPTYTLDLAAALLRLIDLRADGIIHATNAGTCSWYEFAQKVVNLAGLRAFIHPVASVEYPARARRPKNSALLSERSLVALRPWEDALKAYLIEKDHPSAMLAV